MFSPLVYCIRLSVRRNKTDAPRCRIVSAAGTVSGVSKQETASLDCQVDADPSNDVHFWWTFLGTPMKSRLTSLQYRLIFYEKDIIEFMNIIVVTDAKQNGEVHLATTIHSQVDLWKTIRAENLG